MNAMSGEITAYGKRVADHDADVDFGGTSILFLLLRERRDAQREGTDRWLAP
jgi:hypothetical protein